MQFLGGLGIHLSATESSPGNGFGGMFNNGPAGPFRLLDQQLAGQASWLLPLAVVGIVASAWTNRRGFMRSRKGQATIVFGMWLLAAGAFFSVANFFHSYYLVTLGPPIAALAAIGLTSAWQSSRRWLVLPVVLIATALIQAHILTYYPTWSAWLTPLVVVTAGIGALITLLVRKDSVATRAATGIALAGLLVAPLVWSGYSTLRTGSGGGIPAAGPQVANTDTNGRFFRGGPPAGFGGGTNSAVVNYLEENQGSATYLVATTNSNSAASIILASGGKPVMSLGGFSGGDPILTVDQFASLVRSGQVRYVMVGGGPGGGRGGSNSIMSWVQANGAPVAGFAQLYDLSAVA